MEIGILALQGAFIEHEQAFEDIGISTHEIRNRKDLEKPMDGLVIPGGESTSMVKLLKGLSMWDKLKDMLDKGLPAFGTCAGLILLAKVNDGCQDSFGSIDIEAKRNGYGRQIDSFFAYGETEDNTLFPLVFIRAPIITSIGPDVFKAATMGKNIVACRNNNILVCAFHPELTENRYFHRLFVDICKR